MGDTVEQCHMGFALKIECSILISEPLRGMTHGSKSQWYWFNGHRSPPPLDQPGHDIPRFHQLINDDDSHNPSLNGLFQLNTIPTSATYRACII